MALADYQVAAFYQCPIWQCRGADLVDTSPMSWSETRIVKDNDETQFDRMSEEELIRSIADRANKPGVKIGMSIGGQHPYALDRNHRRREKRRKPRIAGIGPGPPLDAGR